jgi:3-oxoacyl-[acyl-carrier protein] reductase
MLHSNHTLSEYKEKNMFSLENRVALVTGGEHGIGKGIAEVLHKAGANIVIGGIDEAAGQQVAKELGGLFIKLDVTRQSDCQAAIAEIEKQFGQLDILCSNAGIFPQANLDEMTEAQWDQVHNVNLKGTFFIVQAAMAAMKKRSYGRIVLTSSITGPVTGFPGWSHYGASKAGQLGFMRSAALEVANSGITINAVMPGNVLTEGLQAQGEEYLSQMRAAIPTHTLGTPEDIGHAACFLASEEARYITGQQIIVDGGQVLPESPDAIPG